MKRKRKGACPSPLLDDSPKRTKVHAQRKFAQGSNVNSPVITPIKELESEVPQIDVLQEPVELLPLKRPQTEDFLTFLCFRGTPILPQTLNFLNTASIVDNNGQVHEIKSESSPKNGPIDIAKCGTSSEKPFIAFGVRKRADPIVISRQMDRKRRHALAIQALRRKYQEQKMAKIRALTISKLSEKVTNRTLVRTNTVSKTETVTKKSSTLQKTKVIATKHVKVTTRTLKTTLRPKIKPKMCLRSFRGRFVQKELPFRKRIAERKVLINPIRKLEAQKKREKNETGVKTGETEKPIRAVPRKVLKPNQQTSTNTSPRMTRSGQNKRDVNVRRKQIKKRILINSTPLVVKPRSLRSTTLKKTILSRRKSRILKSKQKGKPQQREKMSDKIDGPIIEEKSFEKKATGEKPNSKKVDKNEGNKKIETKKEITKSTDIKRDFRKTLDIKKESARLLERNKKLINKSLDIKKEITKSGNKIDFNKTIEIKKSSRISNIVKRKEVNTNKNNKKDVAVEKQTEKRNDADAKSKKEPTKVAESSRKLKKRQFSPSKEILLTKDVEELQKQAKIVDKLDQDKQKTVPTVKKDSIDASINSESEENESQIKKKMGLRNKTKIEETDTRKDESPNKKTSDKFEEEKLSPKMSQRPSRKTKEAAAIYMEILSRKLVDNKVDDDNVSIDSFPELPNVKKTEQRENELKAQAKCTKDDCKEKLTEKVDLELKSMENTFGPKPKHVDDTLKTDRELNIDLEVKTKTRQADNNSKITNVKKLEAVDNEIDFKDNPKTRQMDAVRNKRDEKSNGSDLPIKDSKEKSTKLKSELDSTDTSNEPNLRTLRIKTKNINNSTTELSKLTNDGIKDDSLISEDLPLKNMKEIPKTKQQSVVDNIIDDTETNIDNLKSSKQYSKLKSLDERELTTNKISNTQEISNTISEPSIDLRTKSKDIREFNKKYKKIDTVQDIPDDIKLNELKDMDIDNVNEVENDANLRKIKPTLNKIEKLDSKQKTSSKVQPAAGTIEEIDDLNDHPKRKTRNSSQLNRSEQSDDSDESFHINVKVPKSRKFTRSKVICKIPKLKESLSEVKEEAEEAPTNTKINSDTKVKVKYDEKVLQKRSLSKPKTPNDKSHKSHDFSSDSDHSTTSEVNLLTLANKAKNKKFSKTKSMKKSDKAFSDSDEEPLSKLTCKSVDGSQGSLVENLKKDTKDVKSVKTLKSLETDPVSKPKRECTKKPQNYLPMLSSSDENEIFHGFDENVKEKSKSESSCIHAPPLMELLSKDLSRRFGKEKVNMSNEQIEKWLKDSAMAGSSIKKENDEMLKFGEMIPTETSLQRNEQLDTEKLKSSLLDDKQSQKTEVKIEPKVVPVKIEEKSVESTKLQVLDRKLIFRKFKKDQAQPNVQAFSPENESSVYAFGEDNEEVISTPFRRPSRRPSSTATSRSEDESSKHDDKSGYFRKPPMKQDITKANREESDTNADTDEISHQFYIPQTPCKSTMTKCSQNSTNKTKLFENKTLLKAAKGVEKFPESDDFKYKVPSSPSASSSSSAKLYKRQPQKHKAKIPDFVNSVYVSDFPKKNEPARLVEAPIFHPTEQEFQDPLEYIERIRHKAEQFGLCRIVPPATFKPECKVSDDMRFTSYNQYVHKMLHRWGPNFKELMAIKKYLTTQNISLTHPPWIGGMEIDLPRLYQTVQSLGGLKEVIEKKKWPKVSELMKIPKSAQDRVTKLDDIYCKYLLPYDTLSPAEREKLFDDVETDWVRKESKNLLKVQQKFKGTEADDSDEDDTNECIVKGRNMALNAFYRIARNTMSMHFKNSEPTAQEVEQEYWKHVTLMQNHICVNSGSIDSGNWGYGFAVSKNSPFARHPWNLKVLTNNNGSLLRSLGPIMGVTVPTLHVGMVFSACCWYRDPHGLPWIEYLHTGGSKIWYGIPNSVGDEFRTAMRKLMPNCCYDKEELWLASDTAMVPPALLTAERVSLCRTVQDPGQFVVVFPKVFTSSVSTGYVVSESVYFAPLYWLKTARSLFDSLRNSCESSMFSLDRLLLSLAVDQRCTTDILRQVLPHVIILCDKEVELRKKLAEISGDHIMDRERMPLPEGGSGKKGKKRNVGEEGDYECELCRLNLFVSMVFDTHEGMTYCLEHGIEMIKTKKSKATNCKFMFTYDDDEIIKFPDRIRTTVENKLQKKIPSKFAGMPTLLK